jgi:hypothetical protein
VYCVYTDDSSAASASAVPSVAIAEATIQYVPMNQELPSQLIDIGEVIEKKVANH